MQVLCEGGGCRGCRHKRSIIRSVLPGGSNADQFHVLLHWFSLHRVAGLSIRVGAQKIKKRQFGAFLGGITNV